MVGLNKKSEIEKDSKNTPKKDKGKIRFRIRLLDDADEALEYELTKNDTGEYLFTQICDKLGGIVERDYFGLRYTDKHKQRQWLELDKSVYKQLKDSQIFGLFFRVKHYPAEPMTDLKQELARYLLYLQIRRDLMQGRLLCPVSELHILGALIVQAEYGDAPEEKSIKENGANPDDSDQSVHRLSGESLASSTSGGDDPVPRETVPQFMQRVRIIYNPTEQARDAIIQYHQNLRGLTQREAESDLLLRASRLPTYGIDRFLVKPANKATGAAISLPLPPTAATETPVAVSATAGKQSASSSAAASPQGASATSAAVKPVVIDPMTSYVYLGLTHAGIVPFVGLQRSHTFHWKNIQRVACDKKLFLVYLKSENNKTQLLSFRCETKAAALALWKWTVDRKCFFTLKQASEAKSLKSTTRIFARGQSFKFSGMSQMELQQKTPANAEALQNATFKRIRQRLEEGGSSKLNPCSTFPRYKPHNKKAHEPLSESHPGNSSHGSHCTSAGGGVGAGAGAGLTDLNTPDKRRSIEIPNAVVEQLKESTDHYTNNILPTVSGKIDNLLSTDSTTATSVTMSLTSAGVAGIGQHLDEAIATLEDAATAQLPNKKSEPVDVKKRLMQSNEAAAQAIRDLDRTVEIHTSVQMQQQQQSAKATGQEDVVVPTSVRPQNAATKPKSSKSSASPSTASETGSKTDRPVSGGTETRLANGKMHLTNGSDGAVTRASRDKPSRPGSAWSQLTVVEIALLLLCLAALCLTVFVLEAYPRRPDGSQPSANQAGLSALDHFSIALRRQPIVNAFDVYVYSPLRTRVAAVLGVTP